MNKKVLVLLMCSVLSLSMLTGCESKGETEFSLFNVEIKSDKSEEALNKFLTGAFEVTYENQTYEINTKECLEYLMDSDVEWSTEKINDNEYFITASMSTGDYITFVIALDTGEISIAEIGSENGDQIIRGQSAVEIFKGLLIAYIKETQDVALDYNCAYCGQQMKQSFVNDEWEDDFCSQECQDKFYEEQKQVLESQTKKTEKSNLVKCKWCGKQYDPKNSNDWENEKYCSKECHVKYDEKQQSQSQKTCKWCKTNKLPSGAGDNDKCSECQQEYWNYVCHDCGKNLSLSEYWSTAGQEGFCASCYEKYKQATSGNNTETSHKTYYCDRCGKDITYTNFVQNVGGYGFLCEGCCMELGY